MIPPRASDSRDNPDDAPLADDPAAVVRERVERALEAAFSLAVALPDQAPTGLLRAMRYAVFPGGARIRPRLCLAVARACGEASVSLTDAAAAAIELLHCASLLHDDLPCFDAADFRRGQPSVHRAFGERLAVLSGDALIVLAFQSLAVASADRPVRLAILLPLIARSVGSPFGIVAGQAWECEPEVPLSTYQRAKTGALFAAAAMSGAVSVGADGAAWQTFGEQVGEAYQVADDLRDAFGDPEELGKPAGRDAALDRPSAVLQMGAAAALARMQALLGQAFASIPDCPGAAELRAAMRAEAEHFLPRRLARHAA